MATVKKWMPWAAGAAGVLFLLSRKGPPLEGEGVEGEGEVGPQPRKGPPKTRLYKPKRFGKPWDEVVKEEDLPPDRAPYVHIEDHRVMFATVGNSVALQIDVPDGEYEIVIRAMLPDIGWAVKLGGKKYGIGLGPPESAPVLEFVAKAVNKITEVVPGPETAKDAKTAAIAAAIKALGKIVEGIPGLVTKARVKVWTKFRAGKWGSRKARRSIRRAIRDWYNPDRLVAAQQGERRGYWRYYGEGPGQWPMVSDEPPPPSPGAKPIDTGDPITAAPDVYAESISAGYLRIIIETANATYPGEIRYDVAVYSH